MSKQAYRQHKSNSKRRGIKFKFTYQDWCSWWEEKLGPNWEQMRGCRKNQYVMARFRDEGSYERGNVRAITASENIRLYNKHRKPVRGHKITILSDEVVKAIYLDTSHYAEIAKKYQITKHKIQIIKQGYYYTRVTNHLKRNICGSRSMKDEQ